MKCSDLSFALRVHSAKRVIIPWPLVQTRQEIKLVEAGGVGIFRDIENT